MKVTGRTMRRGGALTGAIVALVVLVASLTACDPFGATKDKFSQAFKGFPATMSTYNQYGQPVDEIKGNSFYVTRDKQFDTVDSKGDSNNDSQVLKISLANGQIEHVGSTMILAQDGLNDITSQIPPQFRFTNNKSGMPWLNLLRQNFKNLWGGTAQTIMIRSQDGTPIKVYGGNHVQVLSTNVPKSTWFRIDGKTLWFYRGDFTLVTNNLLPQ